MNLLMALLKMTLTCIMFTYEYTVNYDFRTCSCTPTACKHVVLCCMCCVCVVAGVVYYMFPPPHCMQACMDVCACTCVRVRCACMHVGIYPCRVCRRVIKGSSETVVGEMIVSKPRRIIATTTPA